MVLILSHTTAYLFWRAFAGRLPALRSVHPRGKTFPGRQPLNDAMLRELAVLGIVPSASAPVHLLYPDSSMRVVSPMVKAHVAGAELPPGSLYQLSDHVLIVSPELCFTQIAHTLPFGKAVLAGYGLCGTYAVSAPRQTDGMGLTSRPPLTTASLLREYPLLLDHTSMRNPARQAASWVLDGAASPMEARVAIMLTLPTTRGGYGLPRPILNAPLPLGPAALKLYPHSPCRLDLYWPARAVAVEYDGKLAHQGEHNHAKDLARLAALDAEGIETMVMGFGQVIDTVAFDTIVHGLAKKLDLRLRIRNATFTAARMDLRAALQVTGGPGLTP